MPFKDLLTRAKTRADTFAHQHGYNSAFPNQNPSSPGPPLVPADKPVLIPSRPYWIASFDSATPVTSNFKHQLGDHGWGNNELQNYIADTSNSFHADNKLILQAIASQGRYTSARLTSHTTLGRYQGCLSFIATIPHAMGIWPAVWLLPSEPFQWPNEGEIDILETWNGDMINHSCLHWGHHNREDHDKHRVIETPLNRVKSASSTHQYEFTWQQSEDGRPARLLWYIDGRPVMKAVKPDGARKITDWQIIMNVAMGGIVCQGKIPVDGYYDLVIHSLSMNEEPRGGWMTFERDWERTIEGHT